MHLFSPEQLLRQLKPFLKDNGCLLIIEPNDSASRLKPDPNRLLPQFLKILNQDKYAGNRQVGARLPQLLQQVGYCEIKNWNDVISAKDGETEKKQDIFQTFFHHEKYKAIPYQHNNS